MIELHAKLEQALPNKRITCTTNDFPYEQRTEILANFIGQQFDVILTTNVLAKHMHFPFVTTVVMDSMPQIFAPKPKLDSHVPLAYDVKKYAYRSTRLGNNGKVVTFVDSVQQAYTIKSKLDMQLGISAEMKF